MSHLAERTETNCLNCGITVLGRYCQACGQENIEPRETVLHLVTHFVGDLFHFDGKFFSTLKYLMFRPGFLSTEYVRGRRMSYLHPIRMYIFASFMFFLFLYAKLDRNVGDTRVEAQKVVPVLLEQQARLKQEQATSKDSSRLEEIRDSLTSVKDQLLALSEIGADDSTKAGKKDTDTPKGAEKDTDTPKGAEKDADTSKGGQKDADTPKTRGASARAAARSAMVYDTSKLGGSDNDLLIGTAETGLGGIALPHTVTEYDSIVDHTPPEKRQSWAYRVFNRKLVQLQEEHRADKKHFNQEIWEHIQETFPKILFVSLPLFALFLRLLNLGRRKEILYVDHGIFTIHLYCASFVIMIAILFINSVVGWTHWGWLDWIAWLLFFYTFFYQYKAMRKFYQQGRAKTIIKFILLNTAATLIVGFVTIIFVMWAVFQV